MATELDSRIWIKSNYNCYYELLKLVNAISKSEVSTNEWNNLRVYEKVPGNKVISDDTATSLESLNDKLDKNKIDDYKISIDVPIKCWRFSGGEVEDGFVVMSVSCWGKHFGSSYGFDITLEGNAQVSILNAGPFCAVISEDENGDIQKVNQFVERNTEKYIDLILKISELVLPEKILTYTDAGQYLLCNVQMAYYNDLSLIKVDIEYFKTLMINGNLTYKIKPIIDLVPSLNSFQLHQWRDLEMQNELKSKIVKFINSDIDINQSRIEEVLDEGRFDFFDKEGKYLVMDYPFFINNFLANFYFELVK